MAPVAPLVPLVHGAAMPQLGLGTWPMDDRQAERAVAGAIEAGYRLFDTAENYGNERGVGRGLRAGGAPRDELFVTTKFNAEWHGVDLVAKAFDAAAGRLGVDYIDLLLVHWPNPGRNRYVDAWRGLSALLADGRVRAVGTSNFKPAHLERIMTETGLVPDVNQIQLSPAVARGPAVAFHTEHGIVTESWSPIGGQGLAVLDEPVIVELADRHRRTPAQVVLRWHVQLGLVPIPKSGNPARMAQNLDVFDFELSDEDHAAVAALDRSESAAVDSDAFGH